MDAIKKAAGKVKSKVTGQPEQPIINSWATGLFDCGDTTPEQCLQVMCVPCFFAAKNKAVVDGNLSASVEDVIIGICPCVELFTRRKIVGVRKIPEEPFTSCLIMCFCYWCMLCQDEREISRNKASFAKNFVGKIGEKIGLIR
eukprot:TRINITY_DN2907_c0_g1_i1.p1 TRINITY_DN2907_c0_g1~~TRINITY_DN2907_c0_g1_i1.p1  ORF type:complete len:143 (+),score=28.97 TRINITY_DN2907_c0_g1_i1:121-549(+)